jgi:hypothetical protein
MDDRSAARLDAAIATFYNRTPVTVVYFGPKETRR